jgi:3-deoxy-D-manno-octulosonic acid kinase
MSARPARCSVEPSVETRGKAYCARAAELDRFLSDSGYTLDSEPRTRVGSLRGRKALEELDSPLGPLVLRRFTHGGILRALSGRRFLDAQRPLREWQLCSALRERGIATPLIVGARARRLFPLGFALDLISVRIEPARDLDALRTDPDSDLGALARQMGAFVRRMHDAGLLHADLTTKNLLWTPQGLVALDLDRSRLTGEPLAFEQRVQNLERLLRFVLRREQQERGRLRPRDYLACLRAYEPEPALRRRLREAVRGRRRRTLFWHRLGWLFP